MQVNNSVRSLIQQVFLLIILFALFASAVMSATPVFTGCPEYVNGNHCDSIFFQVVAVDTSNSGNRNNVRYHLVSGPGEIDERTGLWVYHSEDNPLPSKSYPVPEVEIAASIGKDTTHGDENCQFEVYANNQRPRFGRRRCGARVEAKVLQIELYVFEATDGDPCDIVSYGITEVTPEPAGEWHANLADAFLTFVPAYEDQGKSFVFRYFATDGIDTSSCWVEFVVPEAEPFALRIETIEDTFQGTFANIDIFMDEQPLGLGGFNLLVSYDATALTFQVATAGTLHEQCEWEYFTYRYGADGNCNGGCPSGLVRLVGISETNNGPIHPSCYEAETPYTMARLSFLISNDRNLECQFMPIRFFWIDCGDNTLSNEYGTELFIASTVKDWDYDSTGIEDIGPPDSLPSDLGVTGICDIADKEGVHAFIDFYNGGMQIICADSIDDRSCWPDLWGYDRLTIATVINFARYFTHGQTVFAFCLGAEPYDSTACYERASYCTDFNGDGTGLTITDFLTLLSIVVVGNEPDSFCTTAPCVSSDSGYVNWNPYERSVRIEIPEPVGAFYLEFSDSIVPVLWHADEFILMYNYDGANTRCFIYSLEGAAFSGEFELSYSGIGFLNTVRMATYNGVTIPVRFYYPTGVGDDISLVPESFALNQNYPNPFNPITTISFDLPEPSHVKLEIFDITGRKVATIKNNLMTAGTHTITWHGRDDRKQPVASGVYLYRLTTDHTVLSKKMLLIK